MPALAARDIPAGIGRPAASTTRAVFPAFRPRARAAAACVVHRPGALFYLPLKFESKNVVEVDARSKARINRQPHHYPESAWVWYGLRWPVHNATIGRVIGCLECPIVADK